MHKNMSNGDVRLDGFKAKGPVMVTYTIHLEHFLVLFPQGIFRLCQDLEDIVRTNKEKVDSETTQSTSKEVKEVFLIQK